VVNCSVLVGDFVARTCATVQADSTAITHMRFILPARSDMLISLAAVTATGEASDAAYTIRVRAGQPPTPGVFDAEVASATRTFSVPNCAYENEELYVAVEGNNIGKAVDF